jgi:hypothetical protein
MVCELILTGLGLRLREEPCKKKSGMAGRMEFIPTIFGGVLIFINLPLNRAVH